jgi:hypothetical protein
MKIDKNKKFETNEDFREFIMSFIKGKFGKVMDIQLIGNRSFKLFLEEGFYILQYGLVYLTDYKSGPQVALYFEHGDTYNGNRLALIHKLLPEADVFLIFNTLSELYKQKMTNALENVETNLNVFCDSLVKYDYVNKVNDDIYILKQNEKQYTLTRTSDYNNGVLSYKFSIYFDSKELAKFETNKNTVTYIFDLLAIISKSAETDSEEINEISKLIESSCSND